MPTVVITTSFAHAVQHLQAPNGRPARVQHSRHGSARFFLCSSSEIHCTTEFQLQPEIFEDLRRLKLIERIDHRFVWPVRMVYQLSDAGKAFKLPAEKYWVKEPTQ